MGTVAVAVSDADIVAGGAFDDAVVGMLEVQDADVIYLDPGVSFETVAGMSFGSDLSCFDAVDIYCRSVDDRAGVFAEGIVRGKDIGIVFGTAAGDINAV